jgi:ABC-type Fe3+-siderophore transport system permease subunit
MVLGLTGLAVVYLFRHELVARRPSSTLLVAGIAAAALMVGTDVYARGWMQPVEFPAQVSAVGLLLLAYVTRYREVRASLPAAPEARRAEDAGTPAPLSVACQTA